MNSISKIYLLLVIGVVFTINSCGVRLPDDSSKCKISFYRYNSITKNCEYVEAYVECPPKLHHVVVGGVQFSGDSGSGSAQSGSNCVKMDGDNLLHLYGVFYIVLDCAILNDAQNGVLNLDDLSLIVKIFDYSTGAWQEIQPEGTDGKSVAALKLKSQYDPLDPLYSTVLPADSKGNFIVDINQYQENICLDLTDDNVTNPTPVCTAMLQVNFTFEASYNGDYKMVLFAKDHPAGYHSHQNFNGLTSLCLCPLEAASTNAVEFVGNHIHTLEQEGEKMPDGILDEMELFVKAGGRIGEKKRGVEDAENGSVNRSAGNWGRCCPIDLDSYPFYECVDNSSCHEAKHTVIVDLPDVCPQ